MKAIMWCAAVLALGFWLSPARGAIGHKRVDLEDLNQHLAGKVIDHTHNHGADRRIWSPALRQCRDLYVYLPPGFDPHQHYPIILFFHGFQQDELSFLTFLVEPLDEAMASGKLPPTIVAAPDGSINGEPRLTSAGSFFVNSNAGNFEDYIIQDVWEFLLRNYPIRPERAAHVIAGASMGGFGAFNLGMKYPDLFGVVAAIFPPLNLRWVNCRGRYMGNFDPNCWGWRTQVDRGHEVIGRFYGVITIRVKRVLDPLFGKGPEAIAAVSRENPIEMLDRLRIPPGLFDMYIAYGGHDEFNIDAQVESFLYRAKQLGLDIDGAYDPKGRHNSATARKFLPGIIDWLCPRLAPFSPPVLTPP